MEIYSDQASNSNNSEYSEDDMQRAIKESLKDSKVNPESKVNTIKVIKEEKLTRELDYKYAKLKKNDLVITSKGIAKLTKEFEENNDDIGKTKFKFDLDGKTETLTLDSLNFSFHKSIKVFVINYLERIFQINYPININEDFESFKESFCSAYNLNEKSVAIIYKNNKLGKKDLKRKFGKDFDYNNDYVTILQAKAKPCINQLESYPTNNYLEEVPSIIMVFTVNVKIVCHGFFLFKASYSRNRCQYTDFEFSLVNTDIQGFKSQGTEDTKLAGKEKKKKASTSEKSESAYSFDKLFKNIDKYEVESLNKIDIINADNEEDDDNTDSGDESKSDDSQENEQLKKMIKVEMGNFVLQPETIYMIKFKINTFHNDVNCINLRNNKCKKFLLKNNLEVTFHIQENTKNNNNQKNYLYFGGFDYTVQTIFDEDEIVLKDG